MHAARMTLPDDWQETVLNDQKTEMQAYPWRLTANSGDTASCPFRRPPGNWRKSRRELSADKYEDQLKPKLTLTV